MKLFQKKSRHSQFLGHVFGDSFSFSIFWLWRYSLLVGKIIKLSWTVCFPFNSKYCERALSNCHWRHLESCKNCSRNPIRAAVSCIKSIKCCLPSSKRFISDNIHKITGMNQGWCNYTMPTCFFHVFLSDRFPSALSGLRLGIFWGRWKTSKGAMKAAESSFQRHAFYNKRKSSWWFQPSWKIWVKMGIFSK